MKLAIPVLRKVVLVRSAIVASLAVGAICIAGVTALPPIPAFAAAETPAVTAPARASYERLERLFQREQGLLPRLQKRLTQAGEVVTKVGDLIDRQKSSGKDTSKLEAALADFKTAVASAQSDYDRASSILDTRAGFDANGEVTDPAQARTTVRTAGKAEWQFIRTARKATRELRTAIGQYRRANTVQPEAPQQQ